MKHILPTSTTASTVAPILHKSNIKIAVVTTKSIQDITSIPISHTGPQGLRSLQHPVCVCDQAYTCETARSLLVHLQEHNMAVEWTILSTNVYNAATPTLTK